MKTFWDWALGIVGATFIWMAVGFDKPIWSITTLYVLIGLVLTGLAGSINEAKKLNKWPWEIKRRTTQERLHG